MKKSNGFSLIEVLVTITITSIGLMGLVSLQMQAVRATIDSGNRSQAIWVFNDIINRIRANEAFSDSYITAGINCNNAATPAPVCSAYHNGTLLVTAAAECTGPEQAAWDLFEISCGTPKDDTATQRFIGNSIDYLPQAQLTIACAEAACVAGSNLTIALTWRAKADNESVTGAARTANSGLITLTDVIKP
jgi:type IV pilus assembly protein PilV